MKKAVPQKQTMSSNEEIYTIVMLISLLYLLAYFLTLSYTSYGIFRDELYYLACANRPAFGYVDHPPLSIWILAVWKFILGDSVFVIRILPAIISTATIFMIGLFTARLGGRQECCNHLNINFYAVADFPWYDHHLFNERIRFLFLDFISIYFPLHPAIMRQPSLVYARDCNRARAA